MIHQEIDHDLTAKVCDIVLREKTMSLSEREWKFRLRGYGYAIKDTDEGQMVTSLLKGDAICAVPSVPTHTNESTFAA
ncbi:hypothetical protein [Rhodalgimonas zhirmunskyi]|uniref:Uncharacterized protein n=1 Tax=Rhodalgimonas zhirmunskyi TaxID=2964767 RepID=A0AAJ1UF29_9RHOB|nr:hypothetical protein [Rhodoalgimonas zhirmunskyi]MDQ2094902.1 hypothetical protein [Rhodoalgimonas zhirmunskyi]